MSGEDHRPKYRRIADDLRARIDSSDLAPGERLPGENELMGHYGVARMTVREALAVLQAEGLTIARKGAGVYVREFRPIRRHSIARLSADQWGAGRSIWDTDAEGRTLVVDNVEVQESAAPPHVATVLGDQTMVERRRRFVLDGKPVLLATSWLPATLAGGTLIAEPDTGPGGTYARLAELGARPTHFREELRARMPTAQETQRLDLSRGTPVIVIYRTAYTADSQPVEVNEMILDSNAYIVEYDFDDPATSRP